MQISIASGKGGTGKTSLSLLLARAHPEVTLIDCDVEEPNCHLFLSPISFTKEHTVNRMIPEIDPVKCDGCGNCADTCLFNAIAIAGNKALLFDELCHDCGGCRRICRKGAIRYAPKPVGVIRLGTPADLPQLRLLSGLLNVGSPSGVPLIRALREETTVGDAIIDCPPGTSCALVNAIKGTDFCILVTEPTPFGKHDLELAVNITKLLSISTGVVINRSDNGGGDQNIENLCKGRQIPVIGKIPHSSAFAAQYASGAISGEFMHIAADIWANVHQESRLHICRN